MICKEGYEWRRQLKNGWFPTLESGEERFRLKLRKSDCCPTSHLGGLRIFMIEDGHHQVDCCRVHGVHMVKGVHLKDQGKQQTNNTKEPLTTTTLSSG